MGPSGSVSSRQSFYSRANDRRLPPCLSWQRDYRDSPKTATESRTFHFLTKVMQSALIVSMVLGGGIRVLATSPMPWGAASRLTCRPGRPVTSCSPPIWPTCSCSAPNRNSPQCPQRSPCLLSTGLILSWRKQCLRLAQWGQAPDSDHAPPIPSGANDSKFQ